MTDMIATIAAWSATMLGLFLVAYTLKKWRRAARACHPMPFRRRKSYMTGLAVSALFVAAPAVVHADVIIQEAGLAGILSA